VRGFRERVVLALVLIDILLQVVDGAMTFVFLRPGWAEELNPLVRVVIEHYGVGPAVCVVKLFAIGLIWLRLTAPPELARGAGAAALAAFYAVVVLMPWATAFANRGDVAPEQRAVGGSGAPP